jgi:hypothetical protein
MTSEKFNYKKDKKDYSNAASDIVDKLQINMIDYNLSGRYSKDNSKILSEIIIDCIKYSAHNPSLSKNIDALINNHFTRKEYLKFLTEDAKYTHPLIILSNNKSWIERARTPSINRMSPKTLLTEMTL